MMFKRYKGTMILAAVCCLIAGRAMAEESFWGWMVSVDGFRGIGVAPVNNAQYQEECGSCHFAYQPGWLPARSWEKMLTPAALHNHFGAAADLDGETLQVIRGYVLDKASDTSYHKLSRKVNASLSGDDAPLRITEVRFFKQKHRDIPEKMVAGNKGVKSLIHCDACHTQAGKGIFKSDTVSIPNYPAY